MNRSGLEDCSEVPLAIQEAERWRVAGEKLHRIAPEQFEALFEFFALSVLGIGDEIATRITESYYLT